MPAIPTVMGLHLKYRLWIAEMNADITILRIFEDYLHELATKRDEPEVKTGIEEFEKEFVGLRAEIDELRHEMHIHKMHLAAHAKKNEPFTDEDYKKANHGHLETTYLAYNKNFKRVSKEFGQFQEKWLC
jgi:hypothetical protein